MWISEIRIIETFHEFQIMIKNNKLSSFFILFCTLISVQLFGQEQLDVEGDAKIRGKLDLHDLNDSTSLYVGYGIEYGLFNLKNTFVGVKAGENTTTGGSNSFFGYQSGAENAGGSNAFFGYHSGKNNDGTSNAFYGYRAGESNENSLNAFFGAESGKTNTSGEYNAFFGAETGNNNSTGSNNTFLGYNSGAGITIGSKNTFIGGETGAKMDTFSGSIAVGYFAKVNCSNCAVIGGTGNNAVQMGIGTDNPASHLDILGTSSSTTPHILINESTGSYARMRWKNTSNASTYWDVAGRTSALNSQGSAELNFFYNDGSLNVLKLFGDGDATLAGNLMENSDRRLKKEISSISGVLYKLNQLHGYYYQWKNRPSPHRQVGLIAQEVQQIFPELVREDDQGMLSVNYTKFVPLLIEGMKEQQEQIKTQQNQIQELTKLVQQLLHAEKTN